MPTEAKTNLIFFLIKTYFQAGLNRPEISFNYSKKILAFLNNPVNLLWIYNNEKKKILNLAVKVDGLNKIII